MMKRGDFRNSRNCQQTSVLLSPYYVGPALEPESIEVPVALPARVRELSLIQTKRRRREGLAEEEVRVMNRMVLAEDLARQRREMRKCQEDRLPKTWSKLLREYANLLGQWEGTLK